MGHSLVIVESPAKAKTIEKYLGQGFKVQASMGHVIDLPLKSLGVDVDHDFQPQYEVIPERKKIIAALKKAAQDVDQIFLAPDPDREGEAIAWHIAQAIKAPNKTIRRVLINEITKSAVVEAIQKAGELNQNLFEAQQARRILDRLVGYKISPLLWKTIGGSLSAGRVQSVAVRIVCERERAVLAFKPREYWSIDLQLDGPKPPSFMARLHQIKGKILEPPADQPDPKRTFIPDQTQAERIIGEVKDKSLVVGKVTRRERKRNPLPPFITSKLQQDAARRFNFPAKKTMQVAQHLYEGMEIGSEGSAGLITYMRTDSPRVSTQATDAARAHIKKEYGEQYCPNTPNEYASKKGAQDAHEAIRPTAVERTPEKVKPYLDNDHYRLYELIYYRFIASQMKPAIYDQTTVDIPDGDYLFRASGSIITFKGFLVIYEESEENGGSGEQEQEAKLPDLKEGDKLTLQKITPEQHFTKPLPRFTEASLVKELEEKGIGRPSTYAAILSTIQDRKYVTKEGKNFVPTPLGFRVNDVLVKSFPDLIEVKFTAKMEEDLDGVEDGTTNWVELLRRFYGQFEKELEQAKQHIADLKEDIPTDIACPKCGKEMVIKWSKGGEFLGCSGYPECKVVAKFDSKKGGEIVPKFDEETGLSCPRCGKPLVIKRTRVGEKEFLGCSGYPKCRYTSDFIRDDKGQIVVKSDQATDIKCDICGKPMIVKRARRGGKEFLGCSGYPDCSNIREFTKDQDGKIHLVERAPAAEKGESGSAEAIPPCEKCGKPMVLRKGRFGAFYSCSGYPKCDNKRNIPKEKIDAAKEQVKKERPAVKPVETEIVCDQCGKPMVIKMGRFGEFLSCSGYPKCKNAKNFKRDEQGNIQIVERRDKKEY